jgi:hypothetical protein
MPFTLRYFDVFADYAVNKPVGVVDFAGPPAGKVAFQGFRLAEAGFRVADGVFNQFVDFGETL